MTGLKQDFLIQRISEKGVHTGSGVGMLAFGSPILAHAIAPPFIINSGFAPKKAGFQRTRSANFPVCQKHVEINIKMEKQFKSKDQLALN